MSGSGWRAGPVVAWTEREGPQSPPPGPGRLVPGALAGSLGVIFAGVIGTDSLCPEHRVMVQVLATFALIGTVVAIVGLIRGWALASFTTLASALAGVAIGVIDAAHDPGRGQILALGFGVVAAGAAILAARQVALVRWDRAVAAELAPLAAPDAPSRAHHAPAPGAAVPAATAEAPAPEAPSLR